MRRRMRMRGLTVVATAIAAVGMAGTAAWGLSGLRSSAATGNRASLEARAAYAAHIRAFGVAGTSFTRQKGPIASAAQNVIDEIVSRFGGANVAAAVVGVPPEIVYSTDDAGSSGRQRTATDHWLYMNVRVPAAGPRENLGLWEANLVAGAARDAILEKRLGTVLGETVNLVLPDGSIADTLNGLGGPSTVAGTSLTPAEIAAPIRASAESAGLSVRTVRVLTPSGAAPIVTATTRDPAGFVGSAHDTDFVARLFGGYGAHDGFFLEVYDAHGAAVYVQDFAARAGTGDLWIRPDLDTTSKPLGGATPGVG